MKAATFFQYGAADVMSVTQVDTPQPKAQQVLIKVNASSVTSGDSHIRRADPWMARLFCGLFRPKINVLGSEFAGVIEAVGADVSAFKAGDRVFGATGMGLGANAEYLCLDDSSPLALTPEHLSDDEAAAIPFGAVTAYYFLQDLMQLKADQRILIVGASGAVGVYAIQIAKYLGAEVTAVCSGKNIPLVTSLGADHAIDYTQVDFTDSDLAPWDVIMDTVDATQFKSCKNSLTPTGVYLPVAGGLGVFLQMALNQLSRMINSQQPQILAGMAVENQTIVQWLKERLEARDLSPVIDRRYDLSQIVDAHRYVDSGRKVGSVILAIAK